MFRGQKYSNERAILSNLCAFNQHKYPAISILSEKDISEQFWCLHLGKHYKTHNLILNL